MGLGLYKEYYFQIFKRVLFWSHSFWGKQEGLDPDDRGACNHTSNYFY